MSLVSEPITSIPPNGYGGEGGGIPPLLNTLLPPTQISHVGRTLSRHRLEIVAMAVLHPFWMTSAIKQLGCFHRFPDRLVGAEFFEGFVDDFWLRSHFLVGWNAEEFGLGVSLGEFWWGLLETLAFCRRRESLGFAVGKQQIINKSWDILPGGRTSLQSLSQCQISCREAVTAKHNRTYFGFDELCSRENYRA